MCGFITGVFGACALPDPACLPAHLAGPHPFLQALLPQVPETFNSLSFPCISGSRTSLCGNPPSQTLSLDVFLGPPLSQSFAIRTPTSSTATASESPEIAAPGPPSRGVPPRFWVSNDRRLTTRTFQLSVFSVRGWRQNLTDLPLVAVGPRASYLTSLTLGFLIVEGIDTHRVAAWIEQDKAEAAPAPWVLFGPSLQ